MPIGVRSAIAPSIVADISVAEMFERRRLLRARFHNIPLTPPPVVILRPKPKLKIVPEAPVKEPEGPPQYRPGTPERAKAIINIVAKYYGIAINDLLGERQFPKFSGPRQVAIFLILEFNRQNRSYSFTRIGKMFRRDHTTIIHATRAVAKRIAGDDEARHDACILRADISEKLAALPYEPHKVIPRLVA